MITADLIAFVRSSLPPAPARILEIGAGTGELAAHLRAAGYLVTAIDPAAEPDTEVRPISLLEADGEFDAAVAVVSLHHVAPLDESCVHLATLLAPGAQLVIDEFDVARFDERALEWWRSQRRALGESSDQDEHPAQVVDKLREHVHPLSVVCDALTPRFQIGEPVRGPYLHRWELSASLREVEVELIAQDLLPATGARLVGTMRTAVSEAHAPP